jgi:hypothetical protein
VRLVRFFWRNPSGWLRVAVDRGHVKIIYGNPDGNHGGQEKREAA